MNAMGREIEAVLQQQVAPSVRRLSLDESKVKNGLGQLVLTLVKLLHELLEKQAIRRMEGGSLSDDEMERLGMALMRQAEEIERLRVEFGLTEEDLNLDLGPLGKLL
jgi:gas vesicle protein GvpK